MARGTIIKRRTKTKGVVYDIKYRTGDGTQVKRAAGPSKQEAQRSLNEALAAVQRGAQRSTSTETFAEVADRWRPRIEPATHRDYEFHLRKRLKPTFGHLKLRQITRAKIEAYLAEQDRDGSLSRKTLNDSLSPCARFSARRCAKASLRAPDDASPEPRGGAALPRRLRRLVPTARRDADRAGLRIGEAIALEWRDITGTEAPSTSPAPPRTAAKSGPPRVIARESSIWRPTSLTCSRSIEVSRPAPRSREARLPQSRRLHAESP